VADGLINRLPNNKSNHSQLTGSKKLGLRKRRKSIESARART
jgi:hypothetical protein